MLSLSGINAASAEPAGARSASQLVEWARAELNRAHADLG